MAKLNKQKADEVGKSESAGGFDVMEPHTLHYRLRDVDPTRSGEKGPYWVWEYECVEAPFVGRRMWNNTSLSENALGFVKATFEAFDVEPDTDTDELIGQIVKLKVSQRTIQSGPRQGELANQVDRVMAKDDDFEVGEGVGATAGGGEDIF